jgi:hypothetical protein
MPAEREFQALRLHPLEPRKSKAITSTTLTMIMRLAVRRQRARQARPALRHERL